jgi:hypothetical protein
MKNCPLVGKVVLLTAMGGLEPATAKTLTQMKQMSNSPNSENVIMQRPAPVHRASLLPIVLLSAAGFTVMTTEFIIVGLLPSMAADLGVSVSQAGLLVSLFALTVAAAGPFLTARLVGYECKNLTDGVPQDIEVDTIVSVTQSVTQTTDISPRLARRQLSCLFPQTNGGLANAFQAPLDCVTPKGVASKSLTV